MARKMRVLTIGTNVACDRLWGDGMEERIRHIIEYEDKKAPLTDEQIARQLGVRRDEVTLLRHKLQIPDSRKRRQPLLLKEMEHLLKQTPSMPSRELTSRLNEMGYEVSRFMVHQLRGKMEAFSEEEDTPKTEERTRQKARKASQAVTFASLIGAKGTLKAAIQQAQAAALYPPNGLHTLFFGASGVGKSRMAEAMYHFAIEQQVMKRNAPFIIFNCADYAKNPQLLLSQLFGYVKGAFTGAQQDKLGLVDEADGGILFLDEIHRLPPEGQENLFYLIDKGVYRRLGEVQFQQKATILIVGATTESPESSLLLTLRRRIPMTIELPALSEWTQQERLSLILHFLNEETDRIGKEVVVQKEVIASLMMYECPANMGQLHSDIRVLLAKAFLKTIHQEEKSVVQVDRYDLPMHVVSQQQLNGLAPELPMLKKDQFLFIPGQRSDLGSELCEDSAQHLYNWVVERYRNLKSQGQSEELIELIVNKELDTRLEPAAGEHEKRALRLQQLVKLVGDQVVQAVEQMLWIAERHMTLDYQRISYALAIHLHGLLDRWPDPKTRELPLESDCESMEYKVALEMAKVVQTIWGITLPDSEVALLEMYLKQCSVFTEPKPMIGVVVTSYGQVAKSMVEVAARLFERKHALAVELYWNDDLSSAIERISASIRQVDQGEGVILLADMGSNLLSEAEWEMRTGARVQVLPNVTTTLVIEVMRKCLYSSESMSQIVNRLRTMPTNALPSVYTTNSKPVAIVTICLTGEGAAKRLDMLLKEKLDATEEQVTILQASSLSIRKLYKEWLEKYHIFAVVGTVNPMLDGIPFISIREIVDETGISFIKRLLLVANGTLSPSLPPHSYGLRELLHPELIWNCEERASKERVIEALASLLREQGFVEQDFAQKVWERERMGNTCLLGAAIPHADTLQTIRPGIAAARLAHPVEWEPGLFVQYVYMLAITEHCQLAVEELYSFLSERQEANQSPDLQALLENGETSGRIPYGKTSNDFE